MRRRLIFLVVVSNILLLIVLAISVFPLTKSRVLEDEEGRFRAQILTICAFLVNTSPTIPEIADFLETVDTNEGTRLAVFNQDGAVGRDAARFADRAGRRPAARYLVKSILENLYPWFYTDANGDRIGTEAVSDGINAWLIEGTIPADYLDAEERKHWVQIGLYYLLAFAISLMVANILARRLIRPVDAAVAAAEAIGRSEFRTEVPTTGPAEIVGLGRALRSMGLLIEGLLTGERERAAHLSHTLRTPLTVITLEVDRLSRTTGLDLEHLRHSIADLEHNLDSVIQRSRQTRDHGLLATCDAHQVLRTHLTYWGELATLQSRPVEEDIGAEPSIVALDEQDLGNVLDVLLSNIFRHTAAGLGYSASLTKTRTHVTITIGNKGGGDAPVATGSSGIGLTSARTTVTNVGGSFRSTIDPDGACEITFSLRLVPPDNHESVAALNAGVDKP